MEMIKKYQESLQEIYDHVGFVEDWVVYPLDFQLDMFLKMKNSNNIISNQ